MNELHLFGAGRPGQQGGSKPAGIWPAGSFPTTPTR